MEKEKAKYTLWLSRINNISLKKQIELLNYFGDASQIFHCADSDILDVPFLNQKERNIILVNRNIVLVNKYIEELIKKEIKYVSITENDYPILLKEIVDPPLVLYYKGRLPSNDLINISIVGTRNCSTYGKSVSFKLGNELGKRGIVIVSGMARGIDSTAHKGALSSKGTTIAVLGCGVDVCYPPENTELMSDIIKNGCVMSEFPPGTKPFPAFFPRRNRIISGISKGLIVVEAGLRSGTLITTEYALEQGREVFAVPGNITSSLSVGVNNLIKDGAYILTSYEDVLNAFNIEETPQLKIIEIEQNKAQLLSLSENESFIYSFISDEPITVDEIVSKSNNQVNVIQYVLTMLEIKGVIQKLPGQRFIRSL